MTQINGEYMSASTIELFVEYEKKKCQQNGNENKKNEVEMRIK